MVPARDPRRRVLGLGDPDRAERDVRDHRWRRGVDRFGELLVVGSDRGRRTRCVPRRQHRLLDRQALRSTARAAGDPQGEVPKKAAMGARADPRARRPLLITVRFIPGGRSILTISSGITRQRRSWFAKWVAIAAVIWATYAAGLAYIVGQPFEDNHTAAFLVAFAAAMTMTIIVEVVRHFRKK